MAAPRNEVPNGAPNGASTGPPKTPRRVGGLGPAIVLALGVLSALALFGASLIDYGDPRVEARANAAAAVETRAENFLLRWAEMRRGEEPPPGAGRIFSATEAGDPAGDDAGAFEPPSQAARPDDAVFEVLLEVALAALREGDAKKALSALEDALAGAPENCQRREEALYAAARAASVLWQAGEAKRAQDVERFRAALMAAPGDAALAGTSVKLLVQWVEPADGEGARALLAGKTRLLPAPRDRALVSGGEISLVLDPWWGALADAMAETGPRLDDELAWNVRQREAAAVEDLVRSRGLSAGEHWVLRELDGALLGLRQVGEALEVTAMDRGAFEAAWNRPAGDQDPIGLQLLRGAPLGGPPEGRSEGEAVALTGSPYFLSVTHRDPEGPAKAQLRRIRWLRAGLGGLGLLVLVAAGGSYRAMSRSRRLAELRSTFVASVSHDLRTPTQAILLLSEMLEQDLVPDGGSKREYQSQIRREAQRMRRLVEDLLDGGRIDRGESARIVRGSVATAPFFDELERAMEERAKDAGALLRMTRGELPSTLYVDGDGVHRVLWNLFENALLHGHLPDAAAEVSIHVEWADGRLVCSVQDAGPGVPERYRETIFGAFERAGDRAKKGAGIERDTGTGLGLAIVRAIARAHGGDAVLAAPHGSGASSSCSSSSSSSSSSSGARFVATFETEPVEGDSV